MKPIPPEILQLYPQPPDAPIPGRPWWRTRAGSDLLWRSDGQSVYDHSNRFDYANPLPHPGFRVGQVWAGITEWGICVIQITAYNQPNGGRWAQYATSPARFASHESTPEAMPTTLAGWFLLADPCCPHLAPWAPSE